ncbi:MAG: YiiX/YebB-like N1pC/P60 family cysteine hydrolase [Pirellulales bacterium]
MTPDDIQCGARTVAHLASYFAERKAAAREMLATMHAGERGYFTPSEDEDVRRLLVSYTQARNALLELVLALRTEESLAPELRPAAFLVGYAAALLLVDGARFLRETVHHRPLVRRKLNEAEPHFGIAAGTYETVQKSLTSPRHAWHLYHARRFFAQYEQDLQRAADLDPLLRPCLASIHEHQERLEIPAARYARARLRVRVGRTVRRIRDDLLVQAIYGVQKLASCLVSDISTRPGHRPALPVGVAAQLRDLARPGDVFVTRKEHAATNYFLPGFWPHAALYLGDATALAELGIETHEHVAPRWSRLLAPPGAEPRRVLEALKDGVWIRSIGSPLASDAIALLRPRLDRDAIATALARGLFHEGKPYDFDFDFSRSDRLVCTEVVYRSYEGVGDVRFALTRRAGRWTLSAEDLLQMALERRHFEPVAVYAPHRAADAQTGAAADEALRATCAATARVDF